MLARSWFDALKSRFMRTLNRQERRASGERGAAARRLRIESLEDRCLLAFVAPVDYAVGASPQAIVTADFNNDTVLDLATANYSDSTVSVLLGKPLFPGTFQPALTSSTGDYPLSIAVGDFNGDGNMDLATANSGDVSVLLGNGTGTFGAASPYYVPYNPTSVAVGDFTGDGTLDIGVTSSYYGYYGYANVLVGDGAGNFSGPNTTELGYGNFTSATAFNADGLGADDFATANTYYGYYYGAVAVLLGDTSGYLQPPALLYTGADALSVAVGDINDDGAIDLVTADSYYYYGNISLDSVTVLLGDGRGGFGVPQTYPSGSFPRSVVLGDFTGDDNVDIVTANYYGNDVSLLYGDCYGGFSTPVSFAAGSYPYALAAGKFNGDTLLDVATANIGDFSVSVLLNDGDWPGPPPPTVSIYDASISEGNTGTTDMTFTIYLSKASAQDITVHYDTANGSAANSDYTGESGDVTIPAGDTTYNATIAVTGDRVWEPTETFVVNLSTPINATIGDGQGIGTIYDDEPVVSINNTTVTEGTGTSSVNATFTVSLSALSDVAVTVHYVLANDTATAGADFTGGSGDVTISANQYSQTFTVAVLGDRLAELTEAFVVNLSGPVNAGISDGQGVGTILDNEPRLSINDVSKLEGNGNNKTMFVFTVTLSAAYDQTVTVNYATSSVGGAATSGSDYTAKNSTLTFSPGVTSMTITIIVIADKTKEADETFFVNLSSPTSPTSNALILDGVGIGTILNDDKR